LNNIKPFGLVVGTTYSGVEGVFVDFEVDSYSSFEVIVVFDIGDV